MGRVLTNNVNMAYAVESSLGVAGSTWYNLEPNEIGAFGATISKVARNPISRNRQRRKGTVTDLDSAVEFDADLTRSAFRDFIEAFVFANGVNVDVTDLSAVAAVDTDADRYEISALSSAQADKFEIDTLIWATGFSNSGNNGLKSVSADISAAATDYSEITVNESLTDESSPPTGARISFAGHRMAAGDAPSWTWNGSSKLATLSLSGVGTELQALGLTVGQFVHIGSIATSTDTTITNAFQNATADDMYGWARVSSFTDSDNVVFDKVDTALQFTDATIATDVDILFGEFFRNVATDNSDYLERSFTFEAEYPNLGSGSTDEYEYAKGNYCNEFSLELPLTDKASLSFGFIGTDTDTPVSSGSRKTGADSATDPTSTTALNTSADIARLRVTDVDESGLTTDFKSLTITLNNNVSPEKVLGTLGAAYMNTGNFEVDIETQLVFTNSDVITRIKSNTTVTMDFILKNDDGVVAFDIPSMTMGGGEKEYPENESVLINITAEAFKDDTLGTSIGVSTIPVPIP